MITLSRLGTSVVPARSKKQNKTKQNTYKNVESLKNNIRMDERKMENLTVGIGKRKTKILHTHTHTHTPHTQKHPPTSFLIKMFEQWSSSDNYDSNAMEIEYYGS